MREQLFVCPFNPAHVMKQFRAHRHVLECRKAHSHLDFVQCPFNALHHYLKMEEELHFASCGDRIVLINAEHIQYVEGNIIKTNTRMPPAADVVTEGEEWD